ncbi:UTP--glucose-1-phosphate uridylyltransferase, partial [bacterium]|nr:UTP--glucose-1-phosphate uridylyltransferase [bacterium]
GMLDVMRERGIEHLFYHQVDNPTAIVCDPVLLGLHQQYGSDLTTKVVAKATPEEKMGVLVSINAKTEIIEYSDLPGEEAHRKDEHGQYVFWAGNTAIHVFRREFMESLLEDELSLPFHIAHKKIPHVDSAGISIDPDQPNGNKFEQFIFDALLHAKVALVVEGDRQREFNPVKNASGSDSPETSKAALARIAKEWVTTAGGEVPKNIKVEISPLLALDENDMKEILPDGTVFQKDAVLKN